MYKFTTKKELDIAVWKYLTEEYGISFDVYTSDSDDSDSDGDIETITQKAIEIYGHISTWDVSNITNFDYLFSFYDDKSSDKAMDTWFYDITIKFNEDISNWDVSNALTMIHMFRGCENFNINLNKWNVSKVKNINSKLDTMKKR